MKHKTHKLAKKDWDGSLDMLWESFRSGLMAEGAPEWLEQWCRKCFISGAVGYYLHILVFPEKLASVHDNLNAELETMSADLVRQGHDPLTAMIHVAKNATGRR